MSVALINDDLTLRPDQAAVRDSYNKRAGQYRAGSEKVQWRGPVALMDHLRPRLSILNQPGFANLDLGAGSGEIGSLLKQFNPGAYVIGVDLSDQLLGLAAQDHVVDEAHVGSVTNLLWVPDRSQDLVTSCGVFDHLTVEDISGLARDIVRVTKPGGHFGFTFEADDTPHPGPKSNSRFNADKLADEFRRNGAQVVEIATLFPAWLLGEKQRPVENRIFIGQVPHVN